jgi:ribonucleotide reductase beta subunit family protein with ferritin-like domain
MNTEEMLLLESKLKQNINSSQLNEEYLLNPENNRLSVYPIQDEDIWIFYKKAQASFWTAEEIDFSKDYEGFSKLKPEEQHFISMVLAFFAASDTIVNINLSERFLNDIKIREANICYIFQMMMESVHSETYSLQIDTIIRDPEQKHKLLNGIKEFPCVAEKANWAVKWIESSNSFAHRLIAFAIVEGIFFSGSFCSIFWLKKRNIMPGLCTSNELIARDEGLHTKFAIKLYSKWANRLPQNEVHEMFMDAIKIETKFICESLPCALIGMNSDLMSEYIKYVADQLLDQLGYDKLSKATNPFDFMESISVEGKTNFFEHRPTQYQKASVFNKSRDKLWELSEDF